VFGVVVHLALRFKVNGSHSRNILRAVSSEILRDVVRNRFTSCRTVSFY
jgi:hypothetical protein